MKPFPNKIPLANLPTKIEKLERFSEQTGISVYIKRDDLTGMEYSGNKIRKLEYAVRSAFFTTSVYHWGKSTSISVMDSTNFFSFAI